MGLGKMGLLTHLSYCIILPNTNAAFNHIYTLNKYLFIVYLVPDTILENKETTVQNNLCSPSVYRLLGTQLNEKTIHQNDRYPNLQHRVLRR